MNNPAVVDIGPLSWVQGEINLALGKAIDALQDHEHGLASADEGQPALLGEARAQLHQAHGALTVVGLDGITRYSEVLEQVLAGLAEGRVAATPATLALCRQALGVISAYLDSLLAGEPDQPLRLLASYRELMALLGVAEVSPAELYFPDLSQRPPRREQEPAPLSAEALATRLKAARLGFQRGLLKWFKGEARGLTEMRNTLNVIEATQRTPAARAFWWLSLGLMDALSAAGLEVDAPLKKLCGRIDAQIARLADGDAELPERLSREVLYYIASAQADSEHLACIRAAYRLADYPTDLPAAATASDAGLRHQPQLRALRTALEAAKEEWNRYANQTASALTQFHGHTASLASTAQALKQLDLARLTASVHAVASMLHNQPPPALDEGLALEVATALLLVDNAVENFSQLGVDFAHQVDVMTGRLTALLRGEPAARLAAMELPQLDDMSRQAQERLLMSQVVREIQGNLAQVEQKLDAYFRDPAARVQELSSVEAPLHQIGGALSMLGETRAVELLQDCRRRIQDFAQAAADEAAFAEVAQQLSALGFFVDKLRHGPADLEALLQNQRPTALTRETLEHSVPEPAALAEEAVAKLTDVAAAEDAGVHAANPAVDALLAVDAPPAVDASLDEPSMGAGLLAMADEWQQEAQAAAAIAAQLGNASSLPPLPAPTSPEQAATEETQRLVLASRETLDAELLGIFLEEAHEVLATIGTQLPQLVEQAGDRDMLASLRRAFHTLKGSGRMVGLDELGEAAWAVEQVMNRWLERDESATASLLVMLNAARRLFSGWVAGLEAGAEVPSSESAALIDLHAACARLLQEATTKGDGEQPVPADGGGDSAEASSAPQVESGLDGLAELPDVALEAAAATHVAASGAGNEPSEEASTCAAPAVPVAPPEAIQLGELSLSPAVFEVYLTEAHEHLAVLQAQQPQLLSTPPDKSMLRASHTLGGVSGTLGILAINALGKALEHALERFALADRPLAAEEGARVGQVIDQLAQMLQQVAELRLPQAAPELVAALQAMTPPQDDMPQPGELLAQPLDSMASADTLAAEVPDMAAVPQPAVLTESYDAAATQFTAPASLVEQRTHLRIRDDLDAQLLPFFLEEGVDLMLEVGVGLRSWRAAPADGAVAAHLQRLLHTLKGSARMAGAMQLGELVHGLETRIIQATRHGAAASGDLLDECEASFDRAQGMFEELQQWASGEREAGDDELAPVATSQPLTPQVAAPMAEQAGQPQAAHELVTPQEGAAPRAQLRVRAELVDQFINEVGEMAIARNRVEAEMRTAKAALLDLTENVIRLRQQLREIEIQAESQLQSQLSQLQEQHQDFDPLEMDRYTRFQELTRMMAESVNDVTTLQHNLLHNLDSANAALTAQARQNRELSQALMSVRMVPFNASADRLYRVVRQTAKELGKRANLELRGGQVELDRSVLEKMLGPIEHLLRNCIAHGIETPAERSALGKAPIGEIQLALSQQGNEIIIDMSDDGAGLNHERIRARAEEQGLLAPGQPIDERQLAQMIFAPGFSTAREVTAVAGRGVGMDVVKAETLSLGGRIELQSTPGQGTRFRIFLPLTLAITQALLVRCGNRVYALPSSMVGQARELKPEAMAEIRRQGGDDWLEHRYPWSYLAQLLGERHAQPAQARRHWLLYLKGADQHLALEVDGLLGNQEIVVKNIGTQLARLPGVIGATVLNDGAIALILNPLTLVQHEQEALLATTLTTTSLSAATERPASQAPVIMVVDDSLTVRKIATRLLTREGYQVVTAKDGVDAMEQLLEVVPAAMLVDIEMPRMDGFELTRNVRSDARLKEVPIVMITSRIAEKHRAYARELGVNAYLGKPYDEQELLELLRGFTSR